MKNKIFQILTTALVIAGLTANVVQAQEATSSPQTTQNLKQRIERIVEEKKDQIKGIINNLDATKQGFIGQVTRISEETITVKTNKATKILPISSQVELLRGSTAIKLSDIAVDNWVVVMGIIQDDNFNPVRILVSADDIRPKTYTVFLGTISDSDRTSFTITPRDNPDSQIQVTTNNKTLFEDLKGEEIDRADIETETQALIIAFDDEGEKIAKRIRLLTTLESDNE